MLTRLQVIPPGHRSLTATERIALTLEILATYCAVRWGARRNELPDTVARLRRGADRADIVALDREEGDFRATRLGWAVSRVLELVPTDSRCLVRSLVLTKLLARRGLPSSLVIGVSAAPEFAAHAWVEQAGTPLLPAYESTYARLVEL